MILRAKGTVIIKMNITVFIITLSIDAGLTERAVARLPNHLRPTFIEHPAHLGPHLSLNR